MDRQLPDRLRKADRELSGRIGEPQQHLADGPCAIFSRVPGFEDRRAGVTFSPDGQRPAVHQDQDDRRTGVGDGQDQVPLEAGQGDVAPVFRFAAYVVGFAAHDNRDITFPCDPDGVFDPVGVFALTEHDPRPAALFLDVFDPDGIWHVCLEADRLDALRLAVAAGGHELSIDGKPRLVTGRQPDEQLRFLVKEQEPGPAHRERIAADAAVRQLHDEVEVDPLVDARHGRGPGKVCIVEIFAQQTARCRIRRDEVVGRQRFHLAKDDVDALFGHHFGVRQQRAQRVADRGDFMFRGIGRVIAQARVEDARADQGDAPQPFWL